MKKKILSVILAAAMALGMTSTAFAAIMDTATSSSEDDTKALSSFSDDYYYSTTKLEASEDGSIEDSDAVKGSEFADTVGITQVMEITYGDLSYSGDIYYFSITPIKFDGVDLGEDDSLVTPGLYGTVGSNEDDKAIYYAAITLDAEASNPGDLTKCDSNAVYYAIGQTAIDLNDLANDQAWSKAGLYTYTVEGYQCDAEGVVHDSSSYTLNVFVQNYYVYDSDGNYIGEAYLAYMVTVTYDGQDGEDRTVTIDGEEYTYEVDAKVDATPTDEEDTDYDDIFDSTDEDNKITHKLSQLNFIDVYTSIANEEDDIPEEIDLEDDDETIGSLQMTKAVILPSGISGGDEFTFNVTLTKSYLVSSNEELDTTYQYAVYDETGSIVKDEDDDTDTGIQTASYGTEVKITMKDGYTVIFYNVYSGTLIKVNETKNEQYYSVITAAVENEVNITSQLVTRNANDAATEITVDADKANTNYATANATVDNMVVFSSGKNSVAYTNTYNETTLTGIILQNLPFILLIVVAAAGLCLGLVSRRRTGR